MRAFLLPLCLFTTLSANTAIAKEIDFAACVGDIRQQALSQGITEQTLVSTLDQAKQRPKVVQLDKSQPEFLSTFEDYYTKRVNDWRTNKGRELLAKHRDFLRELTHRYGVPGPYLIAFWGLETNYGNYKGNIPTLDALSTLACDPRRKTFFTRELLTVLDIIQTQQLDVSTLKGSWAGAMGHTQFMPSTYAQYAIDGDGDGLIDLFNSERDALASAANFLHQLGWQAGYRWGREILLPENFDYRLADKNQRHPLSFWRKQGVQTVFGHPLPDIDLEAAVIVPSGYRGPVFLAYHNFRVIMRWNNSQSYAIAVGKLAEQINHAPGIVTEFPANVKIRMVEAKALQRALKDRGYNISGVDGIIGSKTRAAIRAFQLDQGLIADGFAHPEVFAALGIERS
jgi:membrane-bound lytic murein transglycosylase B